MTQQKPNKPLVSRDLAIALRDAGFPQEMRVGDWGIHPQAKALVLCTLARKRQKGVQPAEDPIVRVPTIEEANEFMRVNGILVNEMGTASSV